MPAAADRRDSGLLRWTVLAVLYGALILGGLLVGRHVGHIPDLLVSPGNETYLRGIVVITLVIYVLIAALPFVPAAEIGLGLMLMLGAEMAALVYACTVFALMLPYLVGRAVPADACAAAFDFFGFRKARNLMLEMAHLDATARLELLISRAPARVVPTLLRHRYLALAFALNLPGNSLLGGGGGIALSAGMSGLYPMPAYLVTVSVAVAPVPLLLVISSLLR